MRAARNPALEATLALRLSAGKRRPSQGYKATAKLIAKLTVKLKVSYRLSNFFILYILPRWLRFPTAYHRISIFNTIKSFRYAEKIAKPVARVRVPDFSKKSQLA